MHIAYRHYSSTKYHIAQRYFHLFHFFYFLCTEEKIQKAEETWTKITFHVLKCKLSDITWYHYSRAICIKKRRWKQQQQDAMWQKISQSQDSKHGFYIIFLFLKLITEQSSIESKLLWRQNSVILQIFDSIHLHWTLLLFICYDNNNYW